MRQYTTARRPRPPRALVVARDVYLQPGVLIESDPWIICPADVCPSRLADVSPHWMPVSAVLKWRTRSSVPSPFTSDSAAWTGAAPAGPNRTLLASTDRTSKLDVPRMATGA